MHIHIQNIIFLMQWLFVISITIRLIVKNQSVSAMLSWLLIIYIVPIIGIILYLAFGEIQLGKKYSKKTMLYQNLIVEWLKNFSINNEYINGIYKQSSITKNFFSFCYTQLNIPPIDNNYTQLLSSPEKIIKNIVKDIKQAKHLIKMEFYIWHSGGLIDLVEAELINAKKRNVKIKILLDSVGSRTFLRGQNCARLKNQGIEIIESLPVNIFRFFFQRIDLRLHRKIVVIDDLISYTGSMNMADPDFFKKGSGAGKWVDIMIRVHGPVSSILSAIHAWDWARDTDEIEVPTIPIMQKKSEHNHIIQVLPSGPTFSTNLITEGLLTIIYAAKKSITITTPYFVPSYNIIEALKLATMRGVEIILIIPEKNDSTMVKWASRNFFDELLDFGIKILLFKDNLLHTKSIIIDEKLALIGSVNMDFRSFMLNFEVTIAVHDVQFTKSMIILQKHYIENTIPLNKEEWLKRSLFSRIIERIFSIFSPLL